MSTTLAATSGLLPGRPSTRGSPIWLGGHAVPASRVCRKPDAWRFVASCEVLAVQCQVEGSPHFARPRVLDSYPLTS